MDIITARQNSIAAFLRPDNSHVLKEIGKSLRKIKNIPKVLASLRKGQGGAGRGGGWGALQQFTFHALNIRACSQEMSGVGGLAIIERVSINNDPYKLVGTPSLIVSC